MLNVTHNREVSVGTWREDVAVFHPSFSTQRSITIYERSLTHSDVYVLHQGTDGGRHMKDTFSFTSSLGFLESVASLVDRACGIQKNSGGTFF